MPHRNDGSNCSVSTAYNAVDIVNMIVDGRMGTRVCHGVLKLGTRLPTSLP